MISTTYGNGDPVSMPDLLAHLVGATVRSVTGTIAGCEEVRVLTDRGELRLYHDQDCCERVAIADVTGDPADLVGGVIAAIEERSAENDENQKPSEWAESWTWTFYEIRTTRGDLTLRWLGESNGYYSESVSADWTPAEEIA